MLTTLTIKNAAPKERAYKLADTLLDFTRQQRMADADVRCRLGANEIYQRLKGTGADIADLAGDKTDYKGLIGKAGSTEDKLALAQKLANRRLACGVLPELEACFAHLRLGTAFATAQTPSGEIEA